VFESNDGLEMQENQVWNVAKGAAAAAAISLVLSASPVQARESNAFPKFPNNAAADAVSAALSPHSSNKSVNVRDFIVTF